MISRRAKATLVLSVLAVVSPVAAHAQLDDRTVVSILRECRKLEDPAARTACYDNIPLRQAAAAAPAAAVPEAGASFGSNQLPQPAAARAAAPGEISVNVSAVTERVPGLYVLTLEDGAQWQFVDAMSSSYDPPRAGSAIEISRAALGSYLMQYAGQRGVRIRRIR